MSLEQNIQELNKNIVKLISILEVYPNPIDEKVIDPKKVEASKAKAEESPIVDNTEVENLVEEYGATPTHTIDEVAELAKKAIQANKTENRPKLKDKMDSLGIAKVSATPPEHIDTMYEFLESLV